MYSVQESIPTQARDSAAANWSVGTWCFLNDPYTNNVIDTFTPLFEYLTLQDASRRCNYLNGGDGRLPPWS